MHKYLLKGDPLKVYRTTAGSYSRILGTSEEFKVVDLSDYEELKEKAQALVDALKWIMPYTEEYYLRKEVAIPCPEEKVGCCVLHHEVSNPVEEALDKWEEE